jgi:hypothetical protein
MEDRLSLRFGERPKAWHRADALRLDCALGGARGKPFDLPANGCDVTAHFQYL